MFIFPFNIIRYDTCTKYNSYLHKVIVLMSHIGLKIRGVLNIHTSLVWSILSTHVQLINGHILTLYAPSQCQISKKYTDSTYMQRVCAYSFATYLSIKKKCIYPHTKTIKFGVDAGKNANPVRPISNPTRYMFRPNLARPQKSGPIHSFARPYFKTLTNIKRPKSIRPTILCTVQGWPVNIIKFVFLFF